jgi:tetratricopeptide (TPR) repeat protein
VEALGTCIALRPDVPWGYTARGLVLALLHRFDEAHRDLDRAQALSPDGIAARLNRSAVYLLQDKRPEAIAEIDALLARPQPPREALFHRAQLYLIQEQPAPMLKCLDDLLHQQPDFAPAHLLRAKGHFILGQSAEALRDLDNFLNCTGRSTTEPAATSGLRGHLIRFIAAELATKDQRAAIETGISELTTAIGKNGRSSSLYADLGALLELQAHGADAIVAYGRAIELAPDDAHIRISRGWARNNLNQLDDARADFEEALRLSPRSGAALAGIGYIEARQKRYLQAHRHASLALLSSAEDYLVVHNVACIFAEMAVTQPDHQREHEDAALSMLQRAVDLWRQERTGPDEIQLIRQDSAFASPLQQRPEFQRLISG